MVPRRDDCPVTGIASKANFVTANAVDTILAVPRRVDLEPVNYLEKEDYGKVPKYLQQVRCTCGYNDKVLHWKPRTDFHVTWLSLYPFDLN